MLSVREVHNLIVGGEATMMEILDLICSRIVEVGKTYQDDQSLLSVLTPYGLLDPPTPTPAKILFSRED